jgi:YVTN family beta-propeller protein
MRFTSGLAFLLLAASPAGAETLLIGNKGENSVSFIDLATGREVARRETGPNPHEIALSHDGKRAAIVSYGGNGIEIFDIARRERLKRIDLGASKAPHGIVWLPDGRIVATAEGGQGLVLVSADLERVTAIPTGQKTSHMVAVAPDASRAYVANMGSGTVSVMDLRSRTKLRDLPGGSQPEGIALTPDGRQLWVADRQGDTVHVFDTARLARLGTIAVGKTPIRVAISPDGRSAITSNYGGGDLTVIDVATRKVSRTLPVSGQPGFGQVTILFSRDGRRLYVAETGIDRIAEVDLASGRVLGRLPAGKQGDGLAIAP